MTRAIEGGGSCQANCGCAGTLRERREAPALMQEARLACVSPRPHCQTFQQELAKLSWDAARECSTICVMNQCHAWARGCDSISATVPKKSPSRERARGQLPRRRHHRAEASWPIDQVRFSGTVRHTTAPGGRWENYK